MSAPAIRVFEAKGTCERSEEGFFLNQKVMKKFILNCATVETDADFWALYCEVVQPENKHGFGRNLHALWDALSAGGPGWPGECHIELTNVDEFARRNPQLYSGLQRIANDLPENSLVNVVFTKSLM